MDLIKRINDGRWSLSLTGALKVLTNKKVLVFIKPALTVAFVFFANRKLESGDFSLLWSQLRILPIAAAGILGFLGIYFNVVRWKLILEFEGVEVSNQTATRTFLFGLLLAFVTPGRLGELFRGVGISEKNKASTLFAVIVDKLFTIAVVFLFAFVCVLAQSAFYRRPPHIQFGILTAVAAVVSLMVLFLVARGTVFKDRPVFRRFSRRIMRLSPRLFSPVGRKISLCTLGAHLALIVQTVIIFKMFGDVSFIKGVVAAGQAYAFMTLMPFFVANMGIREYSFHLFLQQLYSEGTTGFTGVALNSSIAILVLNLILPASIGLIWSLMPAYGRRNQDAG